MAHVTLDTLVPVMQALSEAAFARSSPFHLSGCTVCGAPTFQYPCPNCHNWADYSDSPAERSAQKAAAGRSGVGSRESFCRRVEAAGGLGPWYFGNFRERLAYPDRGHVGDPAFKRAVDDVVARAATLTWPDPGDVWDAVVVAKVKFPPVDYWTDRIRQREARALQEFGAEGLAAIKAVRGGQSAWPDNCGEARRFLAKIAEEALVEFGVLDNHQSPGPRQ